MDDIWYPYISTWLHRPNASPEFVVRLTLSLSVLRVQPLSALSIMFLRRLIRRTLRRQATPRLPRPVVRHMAAYGF
jgi:hypothetical protein